MYRALSPRQENSGKTLAEMNELHQAWEELSTLDLIFFGVGWVWVSGIGFFRLRPRREGVLIIDLGSVLK